MAAYWTWTGNAGDGNFNTPNNWSPAGPPDNSQSGGFSVPGGVTIALGNAIVVNAITVTGTGTAAFTGGYVMSANGLSFSATGETLGLGTSALTVHGTMSGVGNFGVTGGSLTVTTGITVNSGQDFTLTNTALTGYMQGSGGTVTLNGSATASITGGSSPNQSFAFSGTSNTLNLSGYYSIPSIQNLGTGDAINYGGATLALVANSGGSTYTLKVSGGGTISSNVTLAAGLTPSSFTNSGGDFEVGCFFPGTMLATADGEIPVEDIVAGTMLKTASGEILPVRWLGWSEVAMTFADPLRTLPIRITAGALADGVPARDLLVSPDHALFLDGMLVQAAALVNGVSILRESSVPASFRYYHVELATHELLLAENCPAESFVDNIDRMNFHNWEARDVAAEPVLEMDCPRAKSARQLPHALVAAISARAGLLDIASAA